MIIILKLIEITSIIAEKLLPAFNVSPEFMMELDKSTVLLLEFFQKVAYFLPLDIMIICFTLMIAIDSYGLVWRIGVKIAEFIRG